MPICNLGKTTAGLFALVHGAAILIGSAASADIVHPDDVIIQGSACIGFDCVNGESFGFDTLRLKENNLRIHFDDTSTASSFPRNDWRLTANESANGGLEKFSIDDVTNSRIPFTIEAGARTYALYIDSSGGDIGIGTNDPAVDLHVKTGNTPTLRLDQDGTSGFTPQTWDVAGNEANFFVRDVTGGSTLPFRIRPGAPTSSIDIAGDGDVFMGLQANGTNSGDLVVGGSGNKFVDLVSTNNLATQFRLISSGGNRRIVAKDDDAAVPDGQIQFLNNSIVLYRDANTQMATFDSGGLDVVGDLTTSGGGACDPGPCDGVFDPTVYEVESIEEHAAYMWANQHLWGVGPTPEGERINLTKKTTGILHELEKAHIYIDQLNAHLKTQGEQLRTQEALLHRQGAEIEELKGKLTALR